ERFETDPCATSSFRGATEGGEPGIHNPLPVVNRHRGCYVPCHTTRHAGPHRAVRWVEVTWQGGEPPALRREWWAARDGDRVPTTTTIVRCGQLRAGRCGLSYRGRSSPDR